MKIKICGITNLEDAKGAVAAGADALGFVMYRKSPRWVDPSLVRAIVAELPPFVLPVGVFVNEEAGTVRALMDECGFALAQLHGDESPLYCQHLGRPALKALRLKDHGTVLTLAGFQEQANVRGFLIDAYSDQAYGGTGQTVDWTLAQEVARSLPIILAGGLTPENVADAIKTVRPYGVDVSSGVEKSPGKKDLHKLKAFIEAARLVPV
ncbi:MAG: phosphoribosylanthranilate isomerase [Nitrospira sp. BO4]|jgi:phosphoribosylanthranilate isomerase|nr:phosphoribosylanthranilate isomerase [Nitrospira sp. BO4]